ncbi:PocR ligand-binding domain-containing protein [Maridesulfovibrio sp.]|uniref:PocR ligand-binding domain-containing protein n=1 Tax=Maridesulfovibrio sp. TaxID=2795000 RepID=UPI002A18E551|nr:PocR ligand-binding domain-containing protein [Maridesulfovibrio sp.]
MFTARLSDDYFRCLIEAIPDLVWLKDPDGVYISCNKAFESFFDVKEEEIIGKTDYDFIEESLADSFRENDKLAMAADGPRVNEEWITMVRTGESRLVETIKTPVRNVSGELLGIMGVARNITARKNIEEALEKRITALTKPIEDSSGFSFEDLFNLDDIQRLQDEFAEATGVGSLITRPDGSPITRPSNFCRLCNDIIRKTELGLANCYKSDAKLGKLKKDGPSIQNCMSGGLWDAGAGISVGGHHVANWLMGQVRDENQDEEKIRVYARKIGADEDEAVEAFMEVTSMPFERFERISKVLFTLANQLSGIAYQNMQQARFINELERTEAELAKTRNLLSNIIDSMPSLLIGVDANCTVTQWNMGAEKATSISRKEALGKPLQSLLPRFTLELDNVREAIRTRSAKSDCLKTRTPTGETRHEDMTIYPLIANGVEGAVLRIDDVTDRVRLEQMMIQSEKMMSVGGLAAGMAHEINNPLAGVLGYALNMKKRIFGDLDKNMAAAEECGISLNAIREYMVKRDIPKMIDGIHSAGTRAAAIVANMLSFSRKSEDKFMLHDVSALLDSTIELTANDFNFKRNYDFKKINIVREYAADVPEVYCDRNEIQQVFLNLLRNGAEAMMDKTFCDEEPRFICRVKKDRKWVVVEIEDNGPGMDRETRRRLFEPFYTTKDAGKGTGLGLSVSYFIITDQHRGRIEVHSNAGSGSCFVIKLPAEEAPVSMN